MFYCYILLWRQMQTSSPFSFQKPNYGTEEGYLLEDTNLIQKENKKTLQYGICLYWESSPIINSTLGAAVYTI